VRSRPKSIALAREGLATLAPLSDLPIDRIRRSQVEDVIAALARRAPRRAEMTLALLKRILHAAESRGQVVDHSLYDVRVASPEDREPRFLTWEEADDVRSWMPEFVSRVVPIAILTMLRRGEVIALRDRDIDFASGAITVAVQLQDGERARTKTRAGRRTVDIGPQTLRLLREQQLARAPNDAGLLFPSREGSPLDPNHLMGRYFKPAARAAGIPELTFHDLRHTGASLMIAAGCHVKTIAEQMGHADGGALVLQRYGHLYKGARRQAAIATESLIFGGPNNSTVPSVFRGDQLVLDPS
jgi:integrase